MSSNQGIAIPGPIGNPRQKLWLQVGHTQRYLVACCCQSLLRTCPLNLTLFSQAVVTVVEVGGLLLLLRMLVKQLDPYREEREKVVRWSRFYMEKS